jgi:ribosomal protein S18 acetylase RimI-like enzyme
MTSDTGHAGAMVIRDASPADEDRIVELSLAAWEPVFASMLATVGRPIFTQLFTADWRRYQEDDVRRACSTHRVWVAEEGGDVIGFTAVDLPDGEPHGEIHMLAVDPAHQGRGTGLALTRHAVDVMRSAGRVLAIVNTGGDPGHAPARATYERAGFTSLPAEQYFLLIGADGAQASES